ncbi:MAG: glycerophosphodiester phosphodiesterase family protein [Pseudomonadota bacterium]
MREDARRIVERLRERRRTLDRPLSIAHRGASAYATENTLTAFKRASMLGADMWEVDVRVTSDGIPVACHDRQLRRLAGAEGAVDEMSWADLSYVTLATGGTVPTLADVIDLASVTGTALYLDLKSPDAGAASLALLNQLGFDDAVLGERDPAKIEQLHQAGCHLPLSILVPVGADPFALADQTTLDMIHPCWEHAAPSPQHLLTDELQAEAARRDLDIITWHEERPDVLADLVRLPVLGICSDQPERVEPYRSNPANGKPLIVAHRGANSIAPENTLAATAAAFSQGCDIVEVDVRTTADGVPVLVHDQTVDRTTNGTGPLASHTALDVAALDAGTWFDGWFRGTTVPTLAAFLDAVPADKGAYIELKDGDPAAIVAMVRDRKMVDSTFFWAKDPALLRALRDQGDDLRLMVRRTDVGSVDQALITWRPTIVEFLVDELNSEEVAQCRAAGIRIMAWVKGGNEAEIAKALEHRPELINTDRPDLVRGLVTYTKAR